MNTKVWNVRYLLGKTEQQLGDAGNPHNRRSALEIAQKIAGNGWCVWVEHERSGMRIYESQAETERQGASRTAAPIQEYPADGLFSTGIKLAFNPHAGWCATVEFTSMLFAAPDCIDGTIGTRYHDQDLSKVIDRVHSAALKIGVLFMRNAAIQPHLYVDGDGEDPAVELPADWREIVRAQCDRLGWASCYEAGDSAGQRISEAAR